MNGDIRTSRSWRLVVRAFVVTAIVSVVIVIAAQPGNRSHDPLTARQLETPTFSAPPPAASVSQTLSQVWSDLRRQSTTGGTFLKSLLPTESGAVWISVIVALMVGLDTAEILSPQNVELVSMLIIGVLLFNVMRFFDFLNDPIYFNVFDWVFSAVVLVGLWLFGRALWRVWHPRLRAWRPNLPVRALMVLTLLLVTLNALTVVIRDPDDAGFYTNLGGQRLRERGMFPYGDKLLTGSPAAAYGPLLFLAHLPFQFMLDPAMVNRDSPNHQLMPDDVYHLPPPLATQLATLAFHLLGVAALVIGVRRIADEQVAWGLAALYCGSAYVLGVGGPKEMVNGLTFISHIAAPSLALAAFALLESPLWAGIVLALSIATVFYPLFFLPAWIGYYSRNRAAMWRFIGGVTLAAMVVGGPVLLLSRGNQGQGRLTTIVRETLGHHQSSAGYGTTPFGFWGGRGGLRGWLQTEVIPQQAASTPMFLIVALFSAFAFFPARRARPQQLALLSACAAILAVTWKILGTGVYVTWYYPFLLIGFFA